jgi:hypothetical protein
LAAVYCAEKIERMGDLAAHIANTSRFAHPHHAVPAELEDTFAELGTVTAGMSDRIGELVTSRVTAGWPNWSAPIGGSTACKPACSRTSPATRGHTVRGGGATRAARTVL